MKAPVKVEIGSTVMWGPDHRDPEPYRVVGMTGDAVRLRSPSGRITLMEWGSLFESNHFAVVGADHDEPAAHRADVLGLAESVGPEETARAERLAAHIREVETGFPYDPAHPPPPEPCGDPDCRPGCEHEQPAPLPEHPRPEYAAGVPLADREHAKLAELAAEGNEMSIRTLRRLRSRYAKEGLWGLVDRRKARVPDPLLRADPTIVQAIRDQIIEETDRSTGTRTRLYQRVRATLEADAERDGTVAPEMPPRATFNRWVAALEGGRHTFGLANSRHKTANSPEGAWTLKRALRPGEIVEFDSSALDVMVLDYRGEPVSAELTIAVDVATRTICAWHMGTVSTKAVDAISLLAQMVVPEPMRPEWRQSLKFAYDLIPHERELDFDERLAAAAKRPVIYPETVNIDRGRVYLSLAFQSACERLGISVQPARPYRPTDKPIVERTFDSIRTLFTQFVAGFTGGQPAHRGKNVEQDAVWRVDQLSELFAEWVVAVWQEREHRGLRFPELPGSDLTPNEAWEIGMASAGYVQVPADPNYYVELLPVVERVVRKGGVTIDRLRYNGPGLNGLREDRLTRQFHVDPNDLSRIYLKRPHEDAPRDHAQGEWVAVEWVHARTETPFSDVLWAHVRKVADARKGKNRKAKELELRDVLYDIQKRATRGELTDPERKVVARDLERTGTGTVARPRFPEPDDDVAEDDTAEDDTAEDDEIVERRPNLTVVRDDSGPAGKSEQPTTDEPDDSDEDDAGIEQNADPSDAGAKKKRPRKLGLRRGEEKW